MKAILVDDEERGLSALNKLIENYCPQITVMALATSAAQGASLIRQLRPDVVFLDIKMPAANGFEMLRMLDEINFEIIFVTAHQEYALKAIKFAALEFLLKPVKISELQEAVEKLGRKKQTAGTGVSRYSFLKESVNGANQFNKIILSTAEDFHFISLEDIIYCQAEDNYTRFMMSNGTRHLVSKPLKEYEDLFGAHNFFRIHKSYLINMNHIEKVIKKDGAMVLMSNKEELPVSFRKKETFFSLLKGGH